MEEVDQKVLTFYNKIRLEIIQSGWTNIIQKHHPDNNIDNQSAWALWKIYKTIYEKIIKETEIKDVEKL